MSAAPIERAPPHIEAATEQLKAAISAVDRRTIDEQTTPWPEIEKSIIKLLGGAFNIQRGDHQAVALGLAGIYAARLISQHQAFWFPNREALEGAALGFPEAVLVVSPFGAVAEALSRGDLSKLDIFAKDIGGSLTRARFSATAPSAVSKLTAEDYRHLFDPSFVQFLAIDLAKAKAAWDANVGQLIADVRSALSRAGARLPKEAHALVEARVITVLQRLDPGKKLREEAERAPRVFELITHLFASVGVSGLAPEEFWDGVVFPLVQIGVPSNFPPLEVDDVTAFSKGMDPLLLFADLVPYRTSAPEDGPLGAFAPTDVSLLDPVVPAAAAVRLVKVNPQRLKPLLDGLDPSAFRDVLKRFTEHLQQKLGKAIPANSASSRLLEPAVKLLEDLKRLWKSEGALALCMRHLTEAEAGLEPALGELRAVLQGPRIILL